VNFPVLDALEDGAVHLVGRRAYDLYANRERRPHPEGGGAAGLFGYVVPRTVNADRTAFVLAIIAIVSIVVFWSGVTPLFAAAALAAMERGDASPTRRVRIAEALAVVATVAALVVTLAQSHL